MIKSTLAIDGTRKFKISIVSKDSLPAYRTHRKSYIRDLVLLINDNVNDLGKDDAIKIEVPESIRANNIATTLRKFIPKTIKLTAVKNGNMLVIWKIPVESDN